MKIVESTSKCVGKTKAIHELEAKQDGNNECASHISASDNRLRAIPLFEFLYWVVHDYLIILYVYIIRILIGQLSYNQKVFKTS